MYVPAGALAVTRCSGRLPSGRSISTGPVSSGAQYSSSSGSHSPEAAGASVFRRAVLLFLGLAFAGSRRRQLDVLEDQLHAAYDDRVPAECHDGAVPCGEQTCCSADRRRTAGAGRRGDVTGGEPESDRTGRAALGTAEQAQRQEGRGGGAEQ